MYIYKYALRSSGQRIVSLINISIAEAFCGGDGDGDDDDGGGDGGGINGA